MSQQHSELYLLVDGETHGPYTVEQVRTYIAQPGVADVRVAIAGGPWMSPGRISELRDAWNAGRASGDSELPPPPDQSVPSARIAAGAAPAVPAWNTPEPSPEPGFSPAATPWALHPSPVQPVPSIAPTTPSRCGSSISSYLSPLCTAGGILFSGLALAFHARPLWFGIAVAASCGATVVLIGLDRRSLRRSGVLPPMIADPRTEAGWIVMAAAAPPVATSLWALTRPGGAGTGRSGRYLALGVVAGCLVWAGVLVGAIVARSRSHAPPDSGQHDDRPRDPVELMCHRLADCYFSDHVLPPPDADVARSTVASLCSAVAPQVGLSANAVRCVGEHACPQLDEACAPYDEELQRLAKNAARLAGITVGERLLAYEAGTGSGGGTATFETDARTFCDALAEWIDCLNWDHDVYEMFSGMESAAKTRAGCIAILRDSPHAPALAFCAQHANECDRFLSACGPGAARADPAFATLPARRATVWPIWWQGTPAELVAMDPAVAYDEEPWNAPDDVQQAFWAQWSAMPALAAGLPTAGLRSSDPTVREWAARGKSPCFWVWTFAVGEGLRTFCTRVVATPRDVSERQRAAAFLDRVFERLVAECGDARFIAPGGMQEWSAAQARDYYVECRDAPVPPLGPSVPPPAVSAPPPADRLAGGATASRLPTGPETSPRVDGPILSGAAASPVPPSAPAAPAPGPASDPSVTIRASSELPRYEAKLAMDGDSDTAWGIRGDPTDQWIEVELNPPAVVAGMSMQTGFVKVTPDGLDVFTANRRLHDVVVYATYADGSAHDVEHEFADEPSWQDVPIPGPRDAPLRTLRIAIKTVFEGARWQDTHVSEVRVWFPGSDSCRLPECERLLVGVPSDYSGQDANHDRNFDLGVCASIRTLRSTSNALLRGAAYYSLGRAWWFRGCPLKAREAFNRSLCVRPTHRNPTVIQTVRDGCLQVGLGPCTGCSSSGPDPTTP